MKWKMFGALAISIGMCSQGMAFELLNRMMSVGHGHRNCCEPTCCVADNNCCEPSCCVADNACCDKGCEPSCCVAEPACCANPCEQKCCKQRKGCDLFSGLKDVFKRNRCKKSCCEQASCCEPSCCVADNACCNKGCEPSCCVVDNCCNKGCEPSCCVASSACCEPACCEQKCCKKQRKGLLDRLFGGCKKKSCCETTCCTTAAACGCNGGHGAPVPAEGGAIDVAPPAPPAPTADPSARYNARRVVPTSARLAY